MAVLALPRPLPPPAPISDVLSSEGRYRRAAAPAPISDVLSNSTRYRPAPAPAYKTPTAGAPAPKTSTAPASPAAGSPSSGASGVPSSAYDLSTDPIVQKIKALNAENYSNAVAGGQAAAKSDLIASGFNLGDILAAAPGLASSPLGAVLADQATRLAAQQNPFSTRAGLARNDQAANEKIDQTDNAANIYYSSTRGNQLADEAKAYLQNQAAAQATLRDQLFKILAGIAGVQQTGSTDLANALETARSNAISAAIAAGETFAGYDANGNPIFSNPNAAPAPAAGVPDYFAPLNNLTPADWARIAALPINQAASPPKRAAGGRAIPA